MFYSTQWFYKRTVNVLNRLDGRAGCSGLSLFAGARRDFFARHGPYCMASEYSSPEPRTGKAIDVAPRDSACCKQANIIFLQPSILPFILIWRICLHRSFPGPLITIPSRRSLHIFSEKKERNRILTGTWRLYNVASTSIRCIDVEATLYNVMWRIDVVRRCINVEATLN